MTRWFLLCVLCAAAATSSSSQSQDLSRLEIRVGFAKPGGGYVQQTIPLETYVARVLAGEAARDSQPAALEALAIAIRTYAVVNRGLHNADGFDVCDQTHCQVVRTATAVTERAAAATAGRVLMQRGVPVPIYYSASCGGHTEIPSAVWPNAKDPSYLPAQRDEACAGAPVWSADLDAADLARAFRAAGFRGDRLSDLRILSRDVSGRVAKLRLVGMTPDEVSGQDLRSVAGRTLGWQHIKSTAFELKRDGNRFRFDGHGYGHGVGMCVIGSVNLAAAGQTAAQILSHYFPGLDIGTLGAPAVVAARPTRAPTVTPAAVSEAALAIALPDEDEGERDGLARAVLRARDDVAKDLGLAVPSRLTIRFHPTTDSYERATGQPWFTAGAVVGTELNLLPLAVLRERGVLERTLRHELVHLMTDASLHDRPAWVREGAAGYFAGDRQTSSDSTGERPAPFPGDTRLSCPSDAELLSPVSAGALSNARILARACFARQAGEGRSWREVK
jgi:stage II sporulation protein D (peptidoglycan lytic transglycosylase)